MRVLVGNFEPILTGCTVPAIRDCLGHHCPVVIIETDEESAIRRATEERTPDLTVLILNNVNYGLSPNYGLRTIIQKSKDLAAYLKSYCEAPMIVMSGLTEDPALPRQLRELARGEFNSADVAELHPDWLRPLSREVVLAWNPRLVRIRTALGKVVAGFRAAAWFD